VSADQVADTTAETQTRCIIFPAVSWHHVAVHPVLLCFTVPESLMAQSSSFRVSVEA
jgi:hypothetical protein